MQHTSGEFEALLDEIEARLVSETDLIANGAVFTALLFEGMEAVDWVGFYFLRDGELVLGPFQGRATRSRLPVQHTIAGRAVSEERAIVVDDLSAVSPDDEYPARSQIILPVYARDAVIGVLQVDSPFVHRFAEADRVCLERAAALFVAHSDVAGFADKNRRAKPRKPPASPARPATARLETVREDVAPSRDPDDDDIFIPSRRARRVAAAGVGKRRTAGRIFVIAFATAVFAFAAGAGTLGAGIASETAQQTLIRKAVVTLLFVAVGLGVNLAWRADVRRGMLLVTLYSAAIEGVRLLTGSQEATSTRIADLFCGALGGYAGAVLARAFKRRGRRGSR